MDAVRERIGNAGLDRVALPQACTSEIRVLGPPAFAAKLRNSREPEAEKKHERTLRQMREKIRSREYVMTTHADEEMWDDGLTIHDVENAVLTGQIAERQKDRHSHEWKYLVRGESLGGSPIVVVAKIGYSSELVIITVYLL